MTHLTTLIQGALIGVANIIPGVSGGTFALVLGIYERLLAALGSFGLRTGLVLLSLGAHPFRHEHHRACREELRRMDARWLGLLVLGALLAVLGSARLITYLLETHLEPTLSFFIGLIIPSILVPYRLLERLGWPEGLACLAGAAGLVGLTLLPPLAVGGTWEYLGLFVAGVLAIAAMILPGVSGSFLLIILGEYRAVLEAINQFDITRLAVFGLGCLLGVAAFVRLLNYLLRRFHAITVAFLIGLILGSLWVLWPFKEIPEGAKIVSGSNVLPHGFTPAVGWSLGTLALGLACSGGILWLGRSRPRSPSD